MWMDVLGIWRLITCGLINQSITSLFLMLMCLLYKRGMTAFGDLDLCMMLDDKRRQR